MDKKELIIIGLAAIVGILIVYDFAWPQEQAVLVEQPAAIIPEQPEIPQQAQTVPETVPTTPAQEPITPQEPAATPPSEPEQGLVFDNEMGAVQQPVPTKENLIPAYVEFQANKLFIPEYFGYPFIPVKEGNIRTFAGKFGPYYYDYRPYIYVELCSYVNSQPEMFACEKVDLNYIDNFMTFVRGYKPDEFIGNVAMRHFGAYYLVRSKEYGILARSNVAPIKLVDD